MYMIAKDVCNNVEGKHYVARHACCCGITTLEVVNAVLHCRVGSVGSRYSLSCIQLFKYWTFVWCCVFLYECKTS